MKILPSQTNSRTTQENISFPISQPYKYNTGSINNTTTPSSANIATSNPIFRGNKPKNGQFPKMSTKSSSKNILEGTTMPIPATAAKNRSVGWSWGGKQRKKPSKSMTVWKSISIAWLLSTGSKNGQILSIENVNSTTTAKATPFQAE